MEMQLSNAVFIAATTLMTFVVTGGAAKLLFRSIKWKWLSLWLVFGIAVTMIQVLGTASPKLTLNSTIPKPPKTSDSIEHVDLIPDRELTEWKEKIDKFDEKQDKRITENID